MVKQKNLINLLPSSNIEKSLFGKVFLWSLTLGRYIVIAIELIVIIAFLSRFKLDKDLADLNDSISQKQITINGFGNLEKDIHFLQERVKNISLLETQQLQAVKTLSLLSSVVPPDMYLNELIINKDSLSIKAITISDASLSIFLAGLQKSNQFSEIDVDSLTAGGTENADINFSLKATIKK